MAYMVAGAVSTSSVGAYIAGLQNTYSYTRKFLWSIDGVYKGYNTSPPYSTTSPAWYFYGLYPGTSYDISCDIYGVVGGVDTYLTTLFGSAGTYIDTPTNFQAVKTSGTSAQLSWNSVYGANSYWVEISVEGGGAGPWYFQVYSTSEPVTNLTKGYTYYFRVSSQGADFTSAWSSSIALNFPLLDQWYWNTTELNAFNNHGPLTDILYSRWNEFVDRIQDAITEDASTWWISSGDGATLDYLSTKMSIGDKTMTAARFNSVRYNIGSRAATGITRKYIGDTIYGNYFITLQNSLNTWISNL